MTDTTVAPQGSAPSAAPSNEVPINPNPVASPNPVGSQAPDKPASDYKGSEHRPESRREAIQKAFERANRPQQQPGLSRRSEAKAEPKAAEAKAGHNNPPEPTEGFDLKKRPADQPGAQERTQHREQGRFARAPDANVNNQAQAGTQPQQRQQAHQYTQLPATTPYRDPPQRMSEAAKAEWHAAPESVRGDFHRMHQEFDGAYRRYRADSETMNSIRPFHEMATQHGTTLQKALTNYVSMEQKLRKDVIGGLDTIVNNLGLVDPQTGQRLGLRDVAYTVLSQSPEQLRMTQQGNAQTAASHQIGALHQEVSGLKNTLQQMHTAQAFNYTRSAVDHYADAHPRFDELGDVIENELKLGFDLDTAYRRAELLRPATHAAQTRTTSAQTRPADKSIYGAPDAGPSNGTSRRNEKPVGRREAIQNAIRRVNGGL